MTQISLTRTPTQGASRQMTSCFLLLSNPLHLHQPSDPPPAKFCMGALMSKGSTETQLYCVHWQSHAQDSGFFGALFYSIKAPRSFFKRAREVSQYWSRRLVLLQYLSKDEWNMVNDLFAQGVLSLGLPLLSCCSPKHSHQQPAG